jgi:phosphoribosyl 1,2-cyclic phosphodiesterase
MIDCGADWLGRLHTISPTSIVLTHAHLDHAGGLIHGAPCSVYATSETQRFLNRCPIHDRREMPLARTVTIDGIRFKACRVEHSIRAPAVGYRVSAKGASFFYLPDVARLPNATTALHRIGTYIGDGATLQLVNGAHEAWYFDRPHFHCNAARMVRQSTRASSDFHPLRLRDRTWHGHNCPKPWPRARH